MKEYISASHIANLARMLRSNHKGTIMIVEGDTDLRVYKTLVDPEVCLLIPAHGKQKVLDSVDILDMHETRGIVGIIDSDFWRIDGIFPISENTFMTDTHDLETMLLQSSALDRVLAEFADEGKVKKLKRPMRDLLLRAALPIGILRWMTVLYRDNLRFKFKNIPYQVFINKKNLTTETDKMITVLKPHFIEGKKTNAWIKRKLQDEMRENKFSPWQTVNGHDMTSILTVGFNFVFGNRKGASLSENQLDAILRLSYDLSQFKKTELYKLLKDWEERNAPFRLFAV